MDFTEFIAAYSPEVQRLANEARRLVREVAPQALEQIDLPAKMAVYSIGPKMADVICTIAPLKAGVNIGIYRAVELSAALAETTPEAAALLQGTGKLHRHVKITRSQDLQAPGLRMLLRAALAAKGQKSGDQRE